MTNRMKEHCSITGNIGPIAMYATLKNSMAWWESTEFSDEA
jgi:hypothetical protein